MLKITFGRPLVRCLAKASFVNQVERQFSQLRVVPACSRLKCIQPIRAPQLISRHFCSEESAKKKKPKKNAPAVEHVGRLDLRIGNIVEVNKAPDADTLYLTKVDIGGDFLSIVAGLAKFIPVDELIGKNVVVLCNCKPSKLRGHSSEGMIMCAKTAETMELLDPPKSANPGDLVYCESYERTIPDGLRDKKKLYDPLAPEMLTNDQLIACYKGSYLYVPDKGNITTKTLKNSPIS